MSTAKQVLQELQDKVNCYESAFQFFLSNKDFFSGVKDKLGSIVQELQNDVHKLQEDAKTIPAKVQQELGHQEANLISKITYEIRKTLKPNFDTELNSL
ncbi:hypothetical protein CPB97_006757 [Podila verticillata]|nr:hypothetical protein CPB97_006757 [Podila verticillata]